VTEDNFLPIHSERGEWYYSAIFSIQNEGVSIDWILANITKRIAGTIAEPQCTSNTIDQDRFGHVSF
jgi:hypothetical protein